MSVRARRARQRMRRQRKLRIPRRLKGFVRYGGFSGFSNTGSIERKFVDTAISATSTVTAGVVLNNGTLNVVAQGTTQSGRIGRKIIITSLHMRAFVFATNQADQDDQPSPPSIRIILGIDKQANKATCAVGDVLAAANLFSFKNLANAKRFITLYDKVYTCNWITAGSDGTDTNTYGTGEKFIQYNKRMRLPIEYSSTTGAIGEITSNNLFCLVIGDSTLGKYQMNFRIRFTDA